MVDVTSSASANAGVGVQGSGFDQLDNFDLFQNVQFDDIFSEIMGECDLSTFEFGPSSDEASNNSAASDYASTQTQHYQLVQLKDADSGLDSPELSSSSSSNASPVPQCEGGSPASTSSSQLDENSVHQFNFAAATEQTILNAASLAKPNEPISIILPETEKDGVKITSEIILNFDQIDERRILEQINHLTEELESSGKESQNEQETCISMLNGSVDSSDDDDEDDMDVSLPNVVLSEEEKKVFIKEGYSLPTHMPMTKSEEKLLKLVRRKIRNKKSAHISRERKKKYIDGLEKRVDQSTRENKLLQKQIELLKNQNQELVTKLKTMQECVSTLVSKHKRSSTAVLFVSLLFAFFAYPYLEIGEVDPSQLNSSASFGPASQVYSRALDNSEINSTQQMIAANALNISSNNYEYYWSYYKKRYDM